MTDICWVGGSVSHVECKEHQDQDTVAVADIKTEVFHHTSYQSEGHISSINQRHRIEASKNGQETSINFAPVVVMLVARGSTSGPHSCAHLHEFLLVHSGWRCLDIVVMRYMWLLFLSELGADIDFS